MNIPLSWREKAIYPLVVAVMIGCCLFSVTQAVERFAGSSLDMYVVTFVGTLAALQSFYTQRLAMDLRIDGVGRGLLYILELALLLALARVGVFASDVITGRPANFNFFVLDFRWMLVIVMMILSWAFARTAAVQFSRLHKLPVQRQETEIINWLYTSPYDVLSSLFFRGGMVLMLFSGIALVGPDLFRGESDPPSTAIILNVLFYFGTGLILLGQAFFDGIRRRWFVDEVKVAEQTGARWLLYSLIVIMLAALLAFLVPISYSSGLLDTLGTVLAAIWSVVSLLFLPFMLLANLLGRLLNALFGRDELVEAPIVPTEELPRSGAGESSLWEWLARIDWPSIQSALSWLIALVVIIYVLRSYLRDHADFSLRLGQIGILRLLRRVWQAIWGSLVGAAEDVGEMAEGLLQQLIGRQGLVRRPLSRLLLGRPSPRERIRYLYLSALNRAASRGIGRKYDQTPYEYKGVLGPRVPDAEEDVVQLTEAFVEARYSQQPVQDGDIEPIYKAWLRLRAALRRARPTH